MIRKDPRIDAYIEKAAPFAQPLEVPDYFTAALKKNAAARTTFETLSPSCQREYIEWLTEAKRETTRQQRLTTSLEWLTEGKPRMWKYQAKSV